MCVCTCGQVKALGVKDINNFAADDLYEAKNMKQVILSILAFGKNRIYIDVYICICMCMYVCMYIYNIYICMYVYI
jgi:hypothetical protein